VPVVAPFFYSIFGIGVDRKHTLKWLFPQEKATFHGTEKVYMYSENALAQGRESTTLNTTNCFVQPAFSFLVWVRIQQRRKLPETRDGASPKIQTILSIV
jgi:hypothetical protein